MNYKIGQKIRIKQNAIEILNQYNSNTLFGMDVVGKEKYQGTIQEITDYSDKWIDIGQDGFVCLFPCEATEKYDEQREQMNELENTL